VGFIRAEIPFCRGACLERRIITLNLRQQALPLPTRRRAA